MKPVFKCEYCSKMGAKEEIEAHEADCIENYTKRDCHTCVHRNTVAGKGTFRYECKLGKGIPEGIMITGCDQHERREASVYGNLGDIFGSFFGDPFRRG